MELYDYPNAAAPNPTKVRIYIVEKGLDIPLHTIDLAIGDQRKESYRAINPLGKVPVLKLNDGTCLPESTAIMEYLEEVYPEPSLIGNTYEKRAQVRALERFIDLNVLKTASTIVVHSEPVFAHRTQFAELAKQQRSELAAMLAILEGFIGQGPFAFGKEPTIADCTLCAAVRFMEAFELKYSENYPCLRLWWEHFCTRPSASA